MFWLLVNVSQCGDTNLMSAASDGPAEALTPVQDEQYKLTAVWLELEPYKAFSLRERLGPNIRLNVWGWLGECHAT